MQTSCKQTSNFQDKVIKVLEDSPDIEFRRNWTQFEIEVLRKYYGRKDPEAIGKALNRTATAVQKKASELKIRGPNGVS